MLFSAPAAVSFSAENLLEEVLLLQCGCCPRSSCDSSSCFVCFFDYTISTSWHSISSTFSCWLCCLLPRPVLVDTKLLEAQAEQESKYHDLCDKISLKWYAYIMIQTAVLDFCAQRFLWTLENLCTCANTKKILFLYQKSQIYPRIAVEFFLRHKFYFSFV